MLYIDRSQVACIFQNYAAVFTYDINVSLEKMLNRLHVLKWEHTKSQLLSFQSSNSDFHWKSFQKQEGFISTEPNLPTDKIRGQAEDLASSV